MPKLKFKGGPWNELEFDAPLAPGAITLDGVTQGERDPAQIIATGQERYQHLYQRITRDDNATTIEYRYFAS